MKNNKKVIYILIIVIFILILIGNFFYLYFKEINNIEKIFYDKTSYWIIDIFDLGYSSPVFEDIEELDIRRNKLLEYKEKIENLEINDNIQDPKECLLKMIDCSLEIISLSEDRLNDIIFNNSDMIYIKCGDMQAYLYEYMAYFDESGYNSYGLK